MSQTEQKLSPCAKWSDDCQGKKDYDGRLLSISTRYWPSGGGFHVLDSNGFNLSEDPTIKPSAIAAIHLNHGEPDEYGYGEYIVLRKAEFEADTFEEIKAKVKSWVESQVNEIYELLKGGGDVT